MWQEKQAEKLRCEIEALLAPLSDVTGLYDLVKEPLTKARRGLAGEVEHLRLWPLLPLIVCEAISGRYEHALPAAAALQCLIAAGDVFDDVEDMDSHESLQARWGSGLATNAGTTLLILAEKAIASLDTRGVADSIAVHIMNIVNSYYITACIGQHLDLSPSSRMAISKDFYLKVTSMKSASQMECACHIGALLATTNKMLIDALIAFGHNLGMAAQITNDINGVINGNDIQKQKITLPVIYALSQTNGKTRNQLDSIFTETSELIQDPTQIRNLLLRCGAIHYAVIKMEFYKQLALDYLFKAEKERANVEKLKLFLE